jgi:type II secretory pathway predicted ATPase ExeA
MYNSYFGFRESPFSVTPDPRFFYTNPVYLDAFAMLRYGIEAKKGFIVITGEVGTGKTTLLRKLLHDLENNIHSVFVFNSCLSFPELLEFTLEDLGLTPKDRNKVTMLQALNDYLIKQLKRGHTVTMLIDEAQNLSDEVLENLRLLSNLETDQEKLIQIVLMGQPELKAKLAQSHLRQLKQRVALQCQLRPLTDKEVRPYIGSRLMAIGYEGKDPFDRHAVKRVTYYSKGIPRVINVLCDNGLLTTCIARQQTVTADMIDRVALDLDLAAEPSKVHNLPALLAPTGTSLQRIPSKRLWFRRMPRTRIGVSSFLMIFFVVVASVIGLGSRHNLTKVVPGNRSEALTNKPPAGLESERYYQRVVIEPGSTIKKIAADTYGPNTILGMDLIKEFNPKIDNLNRVLSGKNLLLVPLSEATLLREQPDGSYHLIVGSFSSGPDAQARARLLAKEGYQFIITTNKVSDDLLLQRVQIVGLKNLKEALQTWNTALTQEWFALFNTPRDRYALSKVGEPY